MATFVSDFWELSDYFFLAPETYDEKSVRKQWKKDTPKIMNELIKVLEGIEDFSSENIETTGKGMDKQKGTFFWQSNAPIAFGNCRGYERAAFVRYIRDNR